jgi:hypothetical protein
VGLWQHAHSLKLRLTYAWGSHFQAAAHPVRVNGAKPALTELSERAEDKAAGQQEQARGGQRPRARAKQPAALITNSTGRCKMFASPSRGDVLEDRAPQSSTQRFVLTCTTTRLELSVSSKRFGCGHSNLSYA